MTTDHRDTFARFQSCVRRLEKYIPRLHTVLGEEASLKELPGWQALCGKPSDFPLVDGKPCLVATLFGPTGGGKSTLFASLTGIDVPASNVTRPLTHSCAAGVPAACLDERMNVASLLPRFTVLPLDDPQQLADPAAPENAVYWDTYPADESDAVWLILVDVPDMNSVEKMNWERAEQMLARAEIVLLVVYPESYADARVMEYLERCCAYAGKLAYVHTKAGRDDARLRWDDVLRRTGEELEGFARQRRDGRSRAEFLAQSPVYYSEPVEEKGTPVLHPLNETTPPFERLVKGEEAADILMGNLAEISAEGVETCRKLCARAEKQAQLLRDVIDSVDAEIEKHAAEIAEGEFAAGEFIKIVRDCVNARRSKVVRVSIMWINRQARAALRQARALYNELVRHKDDPSLRTRKDLEKERLREAAERLVDVWREKKEITLFTPLAMARCRQTCDAFQKREPPPVESDWEEAVRGDVKKWMEKHYWLSLAAGKFADILVVLGGTAIVVDLCVAGGSGSVLFGGILMESVGVVGTGGAGVGVPAVLMKFFQRYGLQRVAERADRLWREQRTSELSGHLRRHLASPLFLEQLTQRLAGFHTTVDHTDETLITACERTCNELDTLMESAT